MGWPGVSRGRSPKPFGAAAFTLSPRRHLSPASGPVRVTRHGRVLRSPFMGLGDHRALPAGAGLAGVGMLRRGPMPKTQTGDEVTIHGR